MEDPILFTTATLTLLLVPGPTNTLLGASGVIVGFAGSLKLLCGELAGYACSILLITTIFAPVMGKSPAISSGLKVAAGLYLLTLAIKIWGTPLGAQPGAVITLRRVFITTLLNPKALIFALIIIPFNSPYRFLYVTSLFTIIPLVGAAWIAAGSLLHLHSRLKYSASVTRTASVILGVFSTILIASAFHRK